MGRRQITEKLSWEDAGAYIAEVAVAIELAGQDADKEVAELGMPITTLSIRADWLLAMSRSSPKPMVATVIKVM